MLFISSITPPKNGTWIINLVMRLFFLPANKSVKELPIPEDNVGKAGVVTGGGGRWEILTTRACSAKPVLRELAQRRKGSDLGRPSLLSRNTEVPHFLVTRLMSHQRSSG